MRQKRMIRQLLFRSMIVLEFVFVPYQVKADPEPNQTPNQIRQFQGHEGAIGHVVFMPDGKSFLSSSTDRTLRRWDISSGKETASINVGRVSEIVPHPNSKFVFLVSDVNLYSGYISMCDLEQGKEVARIKTPAHQVLIPPGGKTIISADLDGAVRMWDIKSGDKIRQFLAWRQGEGDGIPAGAPPQTSVVGISLSPMAVNLATAAWRNNLVIVWDLNSGEKVRTWSSKFGRPTCISYTPDGKYLIVGTNSDRQPGVQLYEADTGKFIKQWVADHVHRMSFSPDGKQFTTVSSDPLKTSVRLWSLDRLLPRWECKGQVTGLEFSPDNKAVLSYGRDNTIRLWQLQD